MSRESEWQIESVRECENERVRERECETERVTFEHRHENKRCSACQEWLNERVREWLLSIDMKTKVVQHVKSDWMREWKSESVWEWESVPGSQLLSDVQTFFLSALQLYIKSWCPRFSSIFQFFIPYNCSVPWQIVHSLSTLIDLAQIRYCSTVVFGTNRHSSVGVRENVWHYWALRSRFNIVATLNFRETEREFTK